MNPFFRGLCFAIPLGLISWAIIGYVAWLVLR